jgi:hypothetical protein
VSWVFRGTRNTTGCTYEYVLKSGLILSLHMRYMHAVVSAGGLPGMFRYEPMKPCVQFGVSTVILSFCDALIHPDDPVFCMIIRRYR